VIFVAAALAAPPPVANGTETDGWVEVGALYAFADAAGGVEVCTATLIDPQAVLTAAHCVAKLEDYAAGGFRVYFLEGPSVDAFTNLSEMATPVAHPDWDAQNVKWDIGVVSLTDPMDTTPATLGTAAMDSGWEDREVRLVGWGNVDLNETGSGVKREGTTTIAGVDDDQFQTAVAAGGGATCPGDSGGAVFDESAGQPVLVGVISWGTLDASDDFPCGTFQGHARVDAAQDWIAEQLAALNAADTGGVTDAGDTGAAGSDTDANGSDADDPQPPDPQQPSACGCQGAPAMRSSGLAGLALLALGLSARRRSEVVGASPQGPAPPGTMRRSSPSASPRSRSSRPLQVSTALKWMAGSVSSQSTSSGLPLASRSAGSALPFGVGVGVGVRLVAWLIGGGPFRHRTT
jgi:MYXO-CTERM domain-containing protein